MAIKVSGMPWAMKVLHGLHVVDGAGHEFASAALVEETVRHPLQMAVHPNHELVHDLIGGDMCENRPYP